MEDEGPRLIGVQTELVREHLVGGLCAAAAERGLAEAAPDGLAEAAAELAGESGSAAGERLARSGYALRTVEVERFEPARRRMPWLAERLAGGESILAVARELALAEPAGRPEPAAATASWRVPGPGGHVRHYVALEAVDRAGAASVGAQDLRRCWWLGFFLRCCEQAAGDDYAAPS